MTVMEKKINSMLTTLDEKQVEDVLKYVEYLVFLKEKETKSDNASRIAQIQDLLAGDNVWKNEDEMLAEMAEFRRRRMA